MEDADLPLIHVQEPLPRSLIERLLDVAGRFLGLNTSQVRDALIANLTHEIQHELLSRGSRFTLDRDVLNVRHVDSSLLLYFYDFAVVKELRALNHRLIGFRVDEHGELRSAEDHEATGWVFADQGEDAQT